MKVTARAWLGNFQRRLAESIMELSGQRVDSSMVPAIRVLSVPEDATVAQVLNISQAYSLSHILVERSGEPREWVGYVCVGELRGEHIADSIRPVISVASGFGKLDTLQLIRKHRSFFALV